MNATPTAIARHATMRKLAEADARARQDRARRADARAHGYHGPLTRDEASRAQLARLAGQ